jgi:TetR/AcrR family transcriptional regulator, regulator of cefoperazone and chloramphenicol sensitivity
MSKKHNEEIKHKLIVSAGQVFAEKGFACASIREICDLAGANVAAVNYYFGDKRNLYREVLTYIVEEAQRRFPFTAALDTTLPAQTRLTELVRTILKRILDKERDGWIQKILDRELFGPSDSFIVLQEKAFEPVFENAVSIVEQLCEGIGADRARLFAASVLGQCSFYAYLRKPVATMISKKKFPEPDIDRLTEIIASISIKGLCANERAE